MVQIVLLVRQDLQVKKVMKFMFVILMKMLKKFGIKFLKTEKNLA